MPGAQPLMHTEESPMESVPRSPPALEDWISLGKGLPLLSGPASGGRVSQIRLLCHPCLDHLATSSSQSITAEVPIMPLSHCYCPCACTWFSHSDILLLALLSSLTFLKNCPPFFSLVYITSILIKNWMEPAWVHLLGLPLEPGRIKGCCKAMLAVRQRWISWRCRHDPVGSQQPRVAEVTWFRTVQPFKRSPSVMCMLWSHSDISLPCGQVYLVGHLQAAKSM